MLGRARRALLSTELVSGSEELSGLVLPSPEVLSGSVGVVVSSGAKEI